MTDARIVATNPADSSVVPVACNENGELLLAETSLDQFVEKDGDTMTGNLHLGDKIILNPDGSAQFAGGLIDFYQDGRVTVPSIEIAEGSRAGKISFLRTGDDDTSGVEIRGQSSGTVGLYVQGNGSVVCPQRVDMGWAKIGPLDSGAGTYPIELNADGTAKFKASVHINDPTAVAGGTSGVAVGASGGIYLYRDRYSDSTTQNGTEQIFMIFTDAPGAKKFPRFSINNAGRITTQASFSIQTEPDNPDNYKTTTDKDGNELREYIGPTLDVKKELQSLRSVVASLVTEIQRVEEKLRMTPESGWEVWDGSS